MNNWKEFKALLYSKEVNKKVLFEAFKGKLSFLEQRKILNHLPKTFNSLLHGSIFPKRFTDIGSQDRGDGYDLKGELNWYVNQALEFPDKIQEFLRQKAKFEGSILLGKFDDSQNSINFISKSIGKSYWEIESQFIHIQFKDGYEANVKWHKTIQENKSKDPAYYFLSGYFHHKVEEDVSILSFQKELKTLQNELEDDNDYKEYFSYRLNFFEYQFKNFERTLWVAKNQSLIDKYLLIRDFLLYNADQADDEQFSVYIKELSSKIDDPSLYKLFLVENINVTDDYNQGCLINIYDLYSEGKYSEAISLINNYIIDNPNNASVSIIYVKCFLYLKQELDLPNLILNTPIGDVLKLLYTFLERSDKSNSAFLEILTITNRIQSFDFAKQVVAFLKDYSDKNIINSTNTNSYLYSKEFNIIDYRVYDSLAEKKVYLKSFKNSITADLFLNLIEGNSLNNFTSIPKNRLKNYKSLWLYQTEQYEDAEIALENALNLNEETFFVREILIQSLFECYCKLKHYNKAINIYVDSYFINENLVSELNIENVAIEISKKDKFKSIDPSNINVPIFMSLSDIRTSNIYVAYNLYLKSLGVKKPSEMVMYLESISKNKIIHFLKQVCTIKVLSRAVMVFKTSIDVLEERLSINQLLVSNDEANQENYSREITQLTRDLNVQRRKKEIDQSKIYVDEFGLLNTEFDNIKKEFSRYRKISELLKDSTFQGLGLEKTSLIQLITGKIDSKAYQKALKNSDYQYNIFVQLFIEIRDQFLFSDKFGLDYYLSTRIRHGTIEGQLRRSFNNTRLVTNRNKELGEYIDDTYWTKRLKLEGDKKELFQEKIKLFSRKIDSIIFHLKNELIQIQTEDSKEAPSGLFDFSHYSTVEFKRDFYLRRCRSIIYYEELVSEIMDRLWYRTEFNLKYIRSEIDNSVRSKILQEIDDFESEINELLKEIDCKEISAQIIQCRTNIQKDIDKVVLWFRRSKSFEVDFQIQDVVASSLDTVTNIDPDTNLRLHENISFDGFIKGSYFIHFDDLLKIFFNNIANYIKSTDKEKINSEIQVKQIDDYIQFTITNDLKEEENIEEFEKFIIEKFKKIKSTVGIRGERDSGLKKASNIILNVFRNSTNELTAEIVNKRVVFICKISLNEIIVK